jgi:hypothetical protein
VRTGSLCGQADQFCADAPQARCGVGVVRAPGRALGLAVGEVPAGDALDIGRGREVHGGGGALFWSLHERPRDRAEQPVQPPWIFGSEAGSGHAGVQHVGGDAGALQAAGQLVGEHDVGQLGLVVGPLSGVSALALQVVEVDATHRLGPGGDGHDPCGCARLEPVEQQVGEQERAEVVDREGVFQAVGRGVAGGPGAAHVVDQHVQAWVPVENRYRQRAHLGLRRHVRDERVDHRLVDSAADVRGGGLGPLPVTADDADPGAQACHAGRGGFADAARSAGDQDGLSGHRPDAVVRHGHLQDVLVAGEISGRS